jgi:hypothetical protein
MVSLILVVCLSATPDVCREEQPPLLEAVTAPSCMMQGQLLAAQWLEEHPKWALKGWRCRIGAPEHAT